MPGKRVTLLAVAAAVALLYLTVDFGDGDSNYVAIPPGPIRLADLLTVASIRSPVTEIPAASSLEQLRNAPRKTGNLDEWGVFYVRRGVSRRR